MALFPPYSDLFLSILGVGFNVGFEVGFDEFELLYLTTASLCRIQAGLVDVRPARYSPSFGFHFVSTDCTAVAASFNSPVVLPERAATGLRPTEGALFFARGWENIRSTSS